MSNPNDDQIALFLKFQQSFVTAINAAEIAALRELVMELLKDNPRLADRANDSYMNQRIYDRVNSQFADLADQSPQMATMFAKLLEQWKASHGIK